MTRPSSIVRWLDAGGRVVAGSVTFHGQDLLTLPARELRAIRGSRIAMVFQDPQTALNPAPRVGPQVAEVLREHEGLSRAEARRRAIDGLAQVNLPDPAGVYDRYPYELRCPRKLGVLCEREEPPAQVSPGHVIHCHIPLDDLHGVAPVVEHVGADR